MIATMLQLLFPIDDRRSSNDWSRLFAIDLPRLARRIEPLFSRAIIIAAAGLFLMMAARIVAAWAAGRL